ncbi:MAG: hypothetical protein ACKOEE_09010, partial [Tagaea sp.]
MQRFIAIHLPTLPTDRAARRADGPARGGPRVTFETAGGTLRVAALDGLARRAGLTRGLGLAEARARRPDLIASSQAVSPPNRCAVPRASRRSPSASRATAGDQRCAQSARVSSVRASPAGSGGDASRSGRGARAAGEPRP